MLKTKCENTFVRSNSVVPERVNVPLVIQNHPCHPLINIIRFLCIVEGKKMPLQVSLRTILLIGLIEIPLQNLLCS